jgi:plasmid stabilization system protein ParE
MRANINQKILKFTYNMFVKLTQDGQDDLDTIFAFIASDSEYYAHIVIAEIRMIFRYFEMNSRMWKQIKEHPETREYVWPYKYLIRYEINNDMLFITAIYKKVYRTIS